MPVIQGLPCMTVKENEYKTCGLGTAAERGRRMEVGTLFESLQYEFSQATVGLPIV